jgi:integrase
MKVVDTTNVLRGPGKERNMIKRGSIWMFQMMIDGKLRRKSTGCKDVRAARIRRNELETQYRDKKFGWTKKAAAPTIEAWAKYVGAELKQAAFGRYLADLASRYQDERLDTFTFAQAAQHIAWLQGKFAQNTVRTTHVGLATAWNYAKKNKYVTENPWTFKLLKRVLRTRVLLVSEQQRMWQYLAPEYQRFGLLALLTGMRNEEMCNLRDDDLIWETRQIRVHGKGDKVRYVPLLPEVEALLLAQIEERDTVGINTGRKGPRYRAAKRLAEGYIFLHAMRCYWENISQAARKAKLKPLHVHDLRRTYATRAAESGVPMVRLQKYLGHENITMTAVFYVHLGEADDAKVLEGVREQAMRGTQAPEVITTVITQRRKTA